MTGDPISAAQRYQSGWAGLPVGPSSGPPPLPPRDAPPPPYSEATGEQRKSMIAEQSHSTDPRSSSMHSLLPTESSRDGRRTLLLVYIHGFMGNETSFQSFPAHVHNLLAMTTAETHVVHTKIYPRYESRRGIEFARDDFSDWLEPHESLTTDVVLLGHSMGGLLSAEVALLPSRSPATGKPFQHRILGTISFDTPFLGMHPGLVASGISSLFRPAPDIPGSKQTPQISQEAFSTSKQVSPATLSSPISSSTEPWLSDREGTSAKLSPTPSIMPSLSDVPSNDPYYNPPFANDVNLPQRPGWSSVLHFIDKHSDGLTRATKEYFMSHIEFGGCLADFPGLRTRYSKLRALEDVDDNAQSETTGYTRPTRRVRFLNYYTASTGIPKKPKTSPSQTLDKNYQATADETEMKNLSLKLAQSHSVTPTPSISDHESNHETTPPGKFDGAQDASPVKAQMENLGSASGVYEEEPDEPLPMQHIDSMPIEEDDLQSHSTAYPTATLTTDGATDTSTAVGSKSSELGLPPIPDMPTEPPPLDLTLYADKDARKLAEKEHRLLQKAHQRAVKDRENAIKDRRKLAEKRAKKLRQEREKAVKTAEKQRLRDEKDEERQRVTINPSLPPDEVDGDAKPKKDRKFCLLPRDVNGRPDACWVRVYMEGVDEVGAHCGLFFPGPHYESLVGDVGARIEEWLLEDARRRELSGEGRR